MSRIRAVQKHKNLNFSWKMFSFQLDMRHKLFFGSQNLRSAIWTANLHVPCRGSRKFENYRDFFHAGRTVSLNKFSSAITWKIYEKFERILVLENLAKNLKKRFVFPNGWKAWYCRQCGLSELTWYLIWIKETLWTANIGLIILAMFAKSGHIRTNTSS